MSKNRRYSPMPPIPPSPRERRQAAAPPSPLTRFYLFDAATQRALLQGDLPTPPPQVGQPLDLEDGRETIKCVIVSMDPKRLPDGQLVQGIGVNIVARRPAPAPPAPILPQRYLIYNADDQTAMCQAELDHEPADGEGVQLKDGPDMLIGKVVERKRVRWQDAEIVGLGVHIVTRIPGAPSMFAPLPTLPELPPLRLGQPNAPAPRLTPDILERLRRLGPVNG